MDIQDTAAGLGKSLPNPTTSGFKQQSTAQDLKARLEWGKPALTILDVRDSDVFQELHITGAMPVPLDALVDKVRASLEPERDIYVYGASDADASQAVEMLHNAGFKNVTAIKGGLEAWKALGGPTDGRIDEVHLDASAYNVVARLAHHFKLQKVAAKYEMQS